MKGIKTFKIYKRVALFLIAYTTFLCEADKMLIKKEQINIKILSIYLQYVQNRTKKRFDYHLLLLGISFNETIYCKFIKVFIAMKLV